ncbi:C4-dicarboxylate transport protein [compost metagenome]
MPIAGMTLILGVDRFMSECRALTNLVGNATAAVVVARWEGELDQEQLHAALEGQLAPVVPASEAPAHDAQPTLGHTVV